MRLRARASRLCELLGFCAATAVAACGPPSQPSAAAGQAAEYRAGAATGYLYVTNETGYGSSGSGSILVFYENAYGNTSPLYVISGSQTQLSQVNGITVDASGEIYVVDTDKNAILGFGAGSSGNVSPNVVIAGSNTDLAWPVGLAIDQGGNLYVANCGSGCKSGLAAAGLLEFAAGSNGNVTPLRNISGSKTQLTRSNGVAWRGDVYVSQASSIVVFDQAANGNAAPKRVISGSKTFIENAWGVATDGDSVFAGSCAGDYIERFDYRASGDAAPQAVISGSKTKLLSCVDGLAFGHGRSYAATINSYPSVVGFHRLANGDVRPDTYLAGPNTQLTYPAFVFATP